MSLNEPVQDLPIPSLLVGVTLAMRLIVDQMGRHDPDIQSRLANQLDAVILNVSADPNGDRYSAHPLLLLRAALQGVRPYNVVEDLLRTPKPRET